MVVTGPADSKEEANGRHQTVEMVGEAERAGLACHWLAGRRVEGSSCGDAGGAD